MTSVADESFCCLYVVQIARGRIKVGQTVNPDQRLSMHRGIAEAHGCIPGGEWVSPRGGGSTANEDELIAFCNERATARFRWEYFTGVPFLAAVREAVRLCGDREAAALLARPRAAQALTELAERRKKAGVLLPVLLEAAEEQRRNNPWLGRPGRCTEAQAAEWLGVSEVQVMALIAAGEIGHIPASGKRRLYLSTDDVERLAREAG